MRRAVWLAIATALGLLIFVGASFGGEGATPVAAVAQDAEPVAPTVAVVSEPAELSCASSLTYGQVLKCDVANAVGMEARWSDGRSAKVNSDGSLDHVPAAVGDVTVELLAAGSVVATASTSVEPDLHVVCGDGPESEVYELVDDDRAEGWNYAYINPETGERVLPGADDYPSDPGLTDYELIVIEEATWTAQCIVASQAVDDLEGTVVWHLMSAYMDEPLRVPIRNLWPFGSNHWNGVQPAEATVTISIGDVQASERMNVYFAGCT